MAASRAHNRHVGCLACSKSLQCQPPCAGASLRQGLTVTRHSLAALWMGCYDRGTAWRATTVQGDEWRELIYLTGSFLTGLPQSTPEIFRWRHCLVGGRHESSHHRRAFG